MMQWVENNALLLIAVAVTAAGLAWLMPVRRRRARLPGLALVAAGAGLLAYTLGTFSQSAAQQVLLALFGGGALVSGALMISDCNPVHAALWFAVVTLCTCGLFVMQSAPFLAAATVIVYAGAIIVTFLFVIMLAQQSGTAQYDHSARRPLAAVLGGAIFLSIVLGTMTAARPSVAATAARVPTAAVHNALSRPPADQPLGTMHQLGRSLFSDYLYAVELAGTLLLIASIGAIVIAPRRGQAR